MKINRILLIWLLCQCIAGRSAFSQSLPEFPIRLMAVSSWDDSKSASESKNILSKHLNINTKRFSFEENNFQKSAQNRAQHFQVLLDRIPVQNAAIHVTKGIGGKALISLPDFDFQHAGALELPDFSISLKENESWTIVPENGKWSVYKKVENHHTFPKTISQTEYYDLNNQLRFVESQLFNFHELPDSTIKAAVFRPDPATKLKRHYGDGIKDRNDSNSVLLTAALDTISLTVHFENDTFELKNDRFLLGEFSLPEKKLARLDTNNFCFTRDSAFFEEVNVFYHLNRFRHYIDSLGFNNLANYQLKVDAHGMDGADQSAYSPSLDVLAYGVGNVDDAEDADVIVHEYGHVLSNSALPFGNAGMERKSLEEGMCDYLAGSYSKEVNDWEWERLFKWDGWNEFWAGRNLLSTKHYPENLVGQIHRDGEIFSSALMNIELLIGRATTHTILLSTMPTLVQNLTMPQAALLFLETDSMLFGGEHSVAIKAAFDSKGISPGNIIVSNMDLKTNERAQSEWVRRIGKDEFELLNSSQKWQQFEIIDQKGSSIQKISGDKILNNRFNIKALPSGIYLLRANSGKEVAQFRFVVFWE